MYAPALLASVPLLAGAAGAILGFGQLPPHFAISAAGASLLTLLAAIASACLDDAAEASALVIASAMLVGLSLGASDAARVYHSPLAVWFEGEKGEGPWLIEGILCEDAVPGAAGVSLLVDVVSLSEPAASSPVLTGALGGVRLSIGGTSLEGRAGEWRAGRRIRTPALLREPSTYLNPGTPDERRALATRGVALVGTVKSSALVEIRARGTHWSEAAAAIRRWSRARIASVLGAVDPAAAGVTAAVLIGDRSGLRRDDERRLQDAGTYHVIAISGGNIAILAIVLTGLWRVLLVPARLGAVFTAALLVFYGSVAGGSASVARAVAVAAIVLGARALDHRAHALNVLAVAAMLGVAAAPVIVLDAGFLLSFGATAGILLGLPRMLASSTGAERRPLLLRVLTGVQLMVAATACAEIVLAPMSATLFGRLSFAGLLLNLVAIPLITVIQVGGLVIVCAASLAPAFAHAIALLLHACVWLLLWSASLVDVAPWLARDVAPPVWWLTAAYYVALAALLVRRFARAGAAGALATGVVLLFGPSFAVRDAVPPGATPVRIVILDVGQGDATAISLPGGRTLLVDAGGLAPLPAAEGSDAPTFDIGDRIVWPALRALNIRNLAGLVLTHGDPDHILGAAGVLRHLPVHEIREGIPVPPHPGLKALIGLAAAGGIPWRTVQAGDVERFGEVEVRVLHPGVPDWERQRVRNDDSVVLEVRVGNVSIVLPGDIGREGEHAILPRLGQHRLVILKAPHHGSATSSTSELLEALKPAAVIFSCGRNNRFGHPHPAVVERYRAVGAEMFSTAEDGAVFVESDGKSVEVRGYHSGRRVIFGGQPPQR